MVPIQGKAGVFFDEEPKGGKRSGVILYGDPNSPFRFLPSMLFSRSDLESQKWLTNRPPHHSISLLIVVPGRLARTTLKIEGQRGNICISGDHGSGDSEAQVEGEGARFHQGPDRD